MGIPLCASIDAEPERMVFRETKVIRTPFIYEGERAGRDSVPGIRRNQIKFPNTPPSIAFYIQRIGGHACASCPGIPVALTSVGKEAGSRARRGVDVHRS